MIALLLTIILNVNLSPCEKTGMIDPVSIITVQEREGTSYQIADLDLFITNEGEARLYRRNSPFLHPLHGHLVQIIHGLEHNDDSYLLRLEASVVRPEWCDLPLSRPRA